MSKLLKNIQRDLPLQDPRDLRKIWKRILKKYKATSKDEIELLGEVFMGTYFYEEETPAGTLARFSLIKARHKSFSQQEIDRLKGYQLWLEWTASCLHDKPVKIIFYRV